MAVQPKRMAIHWQLIIAAIPILLGVGYNYAHANYVDGQNAQIITQIQRDIQDLQNYRNQDQKANDKIDLRLDQLQLDAAILKTKFEDLKK